jgi:hypothetical protein
MLKMFSEFDVQFFFFLHGKASVFLLPLSYRLDKPKIGDLFLRRPYRPWGPTGSYPVDSGALSQGLKPLGHKADHLHLVPWLRTHIT